MGNLANWAEGSHIILIIFTTGDHCRNLMESKIIFSRTCPQRFLPSPLHREFAQDDFIGTGGASSPRVCGENQLSFHSPDYECFCIVGFGRDVNGIFRQVRHLGEGRQLVWRRGFDVLATGKTKLSPDPRISVHQKGF